MFSGGPGSACPEQKERFFSQLQSQCSNVKIAITNVIQYVFPIIAEIPGLELPWLPLIETLDLRLQEVFVTINAYKDLDDREQQAQVAEIEQLKQDIVRLEDQYRMERSVRLATEELLRLEKLLREKDAEAVKSRQVWEEATRKFQEECLQRRIQEVEQGRFTEPRADVRKPNHDMLRRAAAPQDKQRRQAEKDKQLAEKDRQLAEKAKQLEAKDKLLAQKGRQLANKDKERCAELQACEERGAWRQYEAMWDVINAPKLSFDTIPWPMVVQPTSPNQVTTQMVRRFIFSSAANTVAPLLDNSKSNPPTSTPTLTRERVKKAQLRWHPDKFARMLARVKEEDRPAVEEAAGLVSRALNALLVEAK